MVPRELQSCNVPRQFSIIIVIYFYFHTVPKYLKLIYYLLYYLLFFYFDRFPLIIRPLRSKSFLYS